MAAGRIVGAARDPGAAGGVGFLGVVGVVALDADRDADRVVRELVDIAQRPAPANAARSTDDAVAIGIILRLDLALDARSEEHTSELQSLMRISYAVFCLKKKNNINTQRIS